MGKPSHSLQWHAALYAELPRLFGADDADIIKQVQAVAGIGEKQLRIALEANADEFARLMARLRWRQTEIEQSLAKVAGAAREPKADQIREQQATPADLLKQTKATLLALREAH